MVCYKSELCEPRGGPANQSEPITNLSHHPPEPSPRGTRPPHPGSSGEANLIRRLDQNRPHIIYSSLCALSQNQEQGQQSSRLTAAEGILYCHSSLSLLVSQDCLPRRWERSVRIAQRRLLTCHYGVGVTQGGGHKREDGDEGRNLIMAALSGVCGTQSTRPVELGETRCSKLPFSVRPAVKKHSPRGGKG